MSRLQADPSDKAIGKPAPRSPSTTLLGQGIRGAPARRVERAAGLLQTSSSFRVSIGLPKPARPPPGPSQPSTESAAAAVQAQFARQINTAYLNAFASAPASLDGFSAAHAATGLVAAVEGNLCAVNRSIESLVNRAEMGTLLRLFVDWPLETTGPVEEGLYGAALDPCLPGSPMEDALTAALSEASETTGEAPVTLLSEAATSASVIIKAFGSPERYLALRLERIRLLRRIFALLASPVVGEVLVPLLVEKALLSVAAAGDIRVGELRKGCEAYAENLFSFTLSLIDEYEKVVASETREPVRLPAES